LVLAPLAMMPGMGTFLFRPMSLAVAFAMLAAFGLAMTFVPAMCMLWLRSHHPQGREYHGADFEHRKEHEHNPPRSPLGGVFARWESLLGAFFRGYGVLLRGVMRARAVVVASAVALLVLVVVGLGS